ncbi:MAG: LysR family transcriptional regulator [Verrucomicrobiota bacterium]|nr:LysR family transcriptional regulator [Verrucomicrobiota bacterium]
MNNTNTPQFLLDSRQLRAFSILAAEGSFTQAAKKLNLTQSAVSHAIKALEEEVGCRLLDRMGKKAVLTQAGEQLLLHTEKILQQMTSAYTDLKTLGEWGYGRLRLGASDTACQYILPTVLREFKNSFPRHNIHIEPADTRKAIDSLEKNSIDLALGLNPNRHDMVEFDPLFVDELNFVVSPNHPWAQTGSAVTAEISKQNFIVYAKSSYTFQMTKDYFWDQKIVLPTFIELGNIEAIKELIKLDLGISVLASWVVDKEVKEGSLIVLPLGRRKLKRDWGILYRKGRRLNLAEETFIGLCRSTSRKYGIVTKPEHS